MTSGKAKEKWRPSLAMIVFAVLAAVAVLPLVGLFFFRLYDNQLIRQTQAELIAQSQVFATIFAREVEARRASGIALGAEIPLQARPDPNDQFAPIRPELDLTANELLRRRPEARAAEVPADPAFVEIGARLMPLIVETQKVTLAGYRILDSRGVVIAGRQEVGQSLAHIDEVAAALRGEYRAVLRTRIPDKPPPPIYSISRGVGVHVFSAMPVIVDNKVAGVIYISRTPNNIFQHFYQERVKFIFAALAVVLSTILIGFVFSRTVTLPMYELIGRAERIRRGDRERVPPAEALRHAGVRPFVAELSRHGRAIVAAFRLYRELLRASDPRTEITADLDQGRGRTAARLASRHDGQTHRQRAEELPVQHPRRCRAAGGHGAAAARTRARGDRRAE
jgi:two-component system sensor histidine kinase CreC